MSLDGFFLCLGGKKGAAGVAAAVEALLVAAPDVLALAAGALELLALLAGAAEVAALGGALPAGDPADGAAAVDGADLGAKDGAPLFSCNKNKMADQSINGTIWKSI